METTDEMLKEKRLLLLDVNAFRTVTDVVGEVVLLHERLEFKLLIGVHEGVPDNILEMLGKLAQDVGKVTKILPPTRTLLAGVTMTVMVAEVLTTFGTKLILQPTL